MGGTARVPAIVAVTRVLGPVATIVGMLAVPVTPTPLPGGGSLRWDAPSGCPKATEVAALVDEHVGDGAREVQAVTADAKVAQDDGGRWSVALTLQAGEGGAAQRSMSVGSCNAAAQAVALAVALAAAPAPVSTDEEPSAPPEDPGVVPVPGDPPAGQDPNPAEPTLVEPAQSDPTAAASATEDPTTRDAEPLDDGAEPEPAPTPADATERPARIRGFLGAGGGVAGGVLPRPSGYVLVEGGVLIKQWQVTLRADYVVQRRVRLDARPDAGGVLSTFGGGALAGPWFELGPLELPLLVGVVAGAFRAEGFGSSSNATRSRPWAAVLVDGGIRWVPLPRLAVELRGEMVVPLVRHTFTLGDPFVVARTGALGGRGFATVSLRLP